MIDSRLPSLAPPLAITVPKPAKVEQSDVHAFVLKEQALEFHDLVDLPSTSAGAASTSSRHNRPSDDLRRQWKTLCTAVQHRFANDLEPDPDSQDVALEQKKAHFRDAVRTLSPDGLIGKFVAGWCDSHDQGSDRARIGTTKIVQAFNRFFGACHSCGVAAQRIDAMLAALSLGEDELFRAENQAELCDDGMLERLEMITQRKLKPSSNLVVDSTFYSTVDVFAARENINIGLTGVHGVRDLSTLGEVLTGQQPRMMTEVAHNLEDAINELLQQTIPLFLIDLHTALSQPAPPTSFELDALQDKHLFTWNALFRAGTSGAELLRNQTYVIWNDMGTAVIDVKWDDLLADFIKRMAPFLGVEALLAIIDANAWAAPLKDDLAQDIPTLATLASASAESYRYVAQHFPENSVAALLQYRDPDKGHTCLHKLAAKDEIAVLIRQGDIDPHLLLQRQARGGIKGGAPFDIMLERHDQQAIEALYFRCLAHKDSDMLLAKMQFAIQRKSFGLDHRLDKRPLPELLRRYSPIFEAEEFDFYRGIGDPEKAACLALLAFTINPIRPRHRLLRIKTIDRMDVPQIDMLNKMLTRTQPASIQNQEADKRVKRILLEVTRDPTLIAFTPQQLEALANVVRLDQDAFDKVSSEVATDSWSRLSAEGMSAFGDLLRVDRATTRSGEKFLFKHLNAFYQLTGQAQRETVAMFTRHRPFITRHARQWFTLDHEQMRQTRRALEAGLLGSLGTIRIDPRWKLANPLINPQKKWFKLASTQMASMTAGYGEDARADKLLAKRFPQLRKLNNAQIDQAIALLKQP